MWLGAKLTFKKLLYDDSGVAMAYTVLASLFIFMLCVSSYAMSENIRQKMELQNACDAAAYSGAVVQADMLSRIAVLNRALSWTYAETNKRQMDYIVDKWATSAWYTYDDYRTNAKSNATSCSVCMISTNDNSHNGLKCSCLDFPVPSWHSTLAGGYYIWAANLGHLDCWYVGTPDGDRPRNINFNGTATPAETSMSGYNVEDNIRYDFNSQGGRTDNTEANQIGNGKDNIDIINRALDGIRNNMNQLICDAVHSSMTAQHFNNYTAYVDGRWARPTTASSSSSLIDGRAVSYLGWENSEVTFLSYSGNTANGAFEAGHNSWWTLTDDESGNDSIKTGIVRNYTSGLVASIAAWAYRHYHLEKHCVATQTYSDRRTFDASELYDTCFSGKTAFPVRLRNTFWGRAGSIIVAAQTPALNPFSVVFRDNNIGSGIYANAVWRGRRNTFAVSASRAGLRFQNKDRVQAGEYLVQYPGDNSTNSLSSSTRYNSVGVWNLCEEDWDAVMLPLKRAWCDTTPGSWVNYAPGVPFSASAILDAAARQFNASDRLFNNNATNNFVHH